MNLFRKLNDNSLYLLSLIMTLVASYFSYGFLHPDEQFYAIDFAAYKAGLIPKITTWEYQTMLRPWLLPAIFTPFLKFFSFLELSPFSMGWLLRMLSAVVAWFALVLLNKRLKDQFPGSISYGVFIFFTHFSFFSFFMQLRTSSENWSTAFLLLAFSLLLKRAPFIIDYLIGGLFLGLAFSIRHQTGLISLGFGMWLLIIKQVGFKKWSGIFLPAIFTGVSIGLIADFWGYETMTFTPWNYLYQNLVLDKISQFGVSPFYSYFVWVFNDLTPVWAIIFIISFLRLLLFDRSHWVLWSVTPFLFLHFFIGHKELRFLYPVVPLLLFSAAQFFPEREVTRMPIKKYLYKSTVWVNSLLLAFVFFKPAYTPLGFYKYIYDNKYSNIKVFKNKQGAVPKLEMLFYKREALNLTPESSLPKEGLYFTTRYRELDQFRKSNCETLYSTYPEWLFNYNYFNWLERSSIWILTKCH